MVIQVDVFIDSIRVSYKVERHIDDIFIAKIDWHAGVLTSSLPQKIFMFRTPAGWKGDDSRFDIIALIGQEIDNALKRTN